MGVSADKPSTRRNKNEAPGQALLEDYRTGRRSFGAF